MQPLPGYIFDTNVFDYMLNHAVPPAAAISKGLLYITNVQLSEIGNVSDETRRTELEKLLVSLSPLKLELQSGVWCDELRWDDEQQWHDNTTQTFIEVRGQSNSIMDAFIGDVAKHRELILVSNDRRLRHRAANAGVTVITAMDFFTDLAPIP